jgi:hypothetical protein
MSLESIIPQKAELEGESGMEAFLQLAVRLPKCRLCGNEEKVFGIEPARKAAGSCGSSMRRRLVTGCDAAGCANAVVFPLLLFATTVTRFLVNNDFCANVVGTIASRMWELPQPAGVASCT